MAWLKITKRKGYYRWRKGGIKPSSTRRRYRWRVYR